MSSFTRTYLFETVHKAVVDRVGDGLGLKPDFERIERVTYQGNDDTSAGSCHKRKRNKIKQKVRNFFSPKERERERER